MHASAALPPIDELFRLHRRRALAIARRILQDAMGGVEIRVAPDRDREKARAVDEPLFPAHAARARLHDFGV